MNQMTCVTFVVAIGAITALLVGSVVAVTQPIRVHAQDTWESTLTTHDVPKQYTKVSTPPPLYRFPTGFTRLS